LVHLFSSVLDLFFVLQLPETQKDIQSLLLRQQVRVLQRKAHQPKRFSRLEKTLLAAFAARMKQITRDFQAQLEPILIFKPDTVLRWHRELVRREWTFQPKASVGRPHVSPELEALVIKFARENARWGYDRIEGELLKLGFSIDRSTVRNLLKRFGISPTSKRQPKSSWQTFLRHYRQQMLACDFLTVETLWLKTIYVLFFIELGTRRVHVTGCTEYPTSAWVTQQARQLSWEVEERTPTFRFLIHDHDAKFSSAFDRVFAAQNIEVIRTPVRAPNANAYAERWVRSVRQECRNHLLIVNERHLHAVLKEYANYYNHRRPHQGLHQKIPEATSERLDQGPIHRSDVLGGIIHDYHRKAA